MRNIALAFTCILSLCATAAEVDQFTRRFEALDDISVLVNKRANLYLEKAVHSANAKGSCQEKDLYKEMTAYFSNHLKGQLIKDLVHEEGIARHVVALEDSIYSDWTILNGSLMSMTGLANRLEVMSPEIKIGNIRVGTDKFEHMFGQGLSYFTSHYLKGKSLEKTLKKGVFKEKFILGGLFFQTGVFSYADFSANFNGMRFWNHILQLRDDVLGRQQNIGPYVECVNGEFEVVKSNPIDFTKYIDPSMDEAINCSKFATKRGQKIFDRALKKLANKDARYAGICPVDSGLNAEMYDKYNVPLETGKSEKVKDYISHWIINPTGSGSVRYTGEFK